MVVLFKSLFLQFKEAVSQNDLGFNTLGPFIQELKDLYALLQEATEIAEFYMMHGTIKSDQFFVMASLLLNG